METGREQDVQKRTQGGHGDGHHVFAFEKKKKEKTTMVLNQLYVWLTSIHALLRKAGDLFLFLLLLFCTPVQKQRGKRKKKVREKEQNNSKKKKSNCVLSSVLHCMPVSSKLIFEVQLPSFEVHRDGVAWPPHFFVRDSFPRAPEPTSLPRRAPCSPAR